MIEPHMIHAILSRQRTCARPAGPKDEDAFYQQYAEPFHQRLYQGWLRFQAMFRGLRHSRKDVQAGHSLAPNLETCR